MSLSITLILVAGTALISFNAFNNADLRSRWIFNPYVIWKERQYYRFITSGFIHADWLHLLFNMLVLWMFGSYVERIFETVYGNWGLVLFGLLYLAGIVVSDIPSFVKHKNSPGFNALGASGGVSSVLFSFILFSPMHNICLYGLLCLPGFVWGVLYIIYTIYMGRQQRDNINHDAHLYGGIFGIVFTAAAVPETIPNFIEQISDFSLF